MGPEYLKILPLVDDYFMYFDCMSLESEVSVLFRFYLWTFFHIIVSHFYYKAEFLHHQVRMQNFCMFLIAVKNFSILLINTVNYFTLYFHRGLRHAEFLHYEKVENAKFLHHSFALLTVMNDAERTCRISASDFTLIFDAGIRMQNFCIPSWLLYVWDTNLFLRVW